VSAKQAVSVLGAGSWGTALACQCARNLHDTQLWGRNLEAMASMQSSRENTRYLPGVALAEGLRCTSDLSMALVSCEVIVIATPTKAVIETLDVIIPHLNEHHVLVWACKGLESGSGRLLHEVFDERLPKSIKSAVISGPSFAGELARNLPTAVTVASFDITTADTVAAIFHGNNVRAYSSDDVMGVEVGGAMKNVYAIAAGISDGLGFGANARAALITRGLAELMRLGVAMGAHPETLMGLSGMGDLVLTCTDDQSRNRRFGLCLAKSLNVEDSLKEIHQVVEGVKTTQDARLLADQYEVEMPIVEQVYKIIYNHKSPIDAVGSLLSRSAKQET